MAPEPDDSSFDDEQLLEALDRYVDSVHSGHSRLEGDLVEKHPELSGLIGCVDELDRLAPQATRNAAPTPDVSRAEPVNFGKYELISELGRGGMGVVYQARQIDLDRVVALKMILSSEFASPEEIRRFYSEAQAAGSLQHSHIVGIHEVGEFNGQHYYAMDYVEGESLAGRLQQGAFDADAAADMLLPVVRAVSYLHSEGILHRDLKPSNILLDGEDRPYVTDFGLAKVVQNNDSRTRTGTIVGTPGYMAPEQAAGRTSDISVRSDVFSLGAILYEMLTGRAPFQKETPLDTLVEVLEGEPTLPSRITRTVPRELELICLRCLEKDPDRRYESADALAEDLGHFLKRESIAARPSGVVARVRRWARREPALASRSGGLLTAAGIVQARYLLDPTASDIDLHLRVMGVFAAWSVSSWVFQRCLNRGLETMRFGWVFADAMWLSALLLMASGPIGPLLVGYPLLIAAAGMFFRVRLVAFMTCCCLSSFVIVNHIRAEESALPHYPLIFACGLAVFGYIIGYQVYRVRVLSRYFEARR